MGIKDILVFLDDGASNAKRVEVAFELAKTHHAEVTGMSLASIKPMHAKLDDDDAIARVSEKLALQLVESFKASASGTGVEVNTIMISGNAATTAEKAGHYARNSDLVILGQPDPAKDSAIQLQNFAQEVLLLSGRPVLFMPYIGIRKFPYEKALIAWDGTPAVSRSVHDAIPLLANTREVTILVVESKKQQEVKKEVLVEGLARHLSHHDVKTKILRVNPGSNNVSTVILNQITDNDIDLLVIGGYGTPTLKQKIFGGVSQTVLSSMLVPTIMSH